VQYFIRRGLDDKKALNRILGRPKDVAANMKDNRKVFEYLIQNTDAPIQTRAMPIQGATESSIEAARLNQSKISEIDDPNVQFIIKQKKLVNGKIVVT